MIVSSEDPKILAIADAAGAEIPFIRPEELAKDETTDHPVFLHALKWLVDNEGYRPDYVVHLRATSPARTPEMVDEALEILHSDAGADSIRSVCIPHNNPFKMWKLAGSYLTPLVEIGIFEQYNQPRQRLPLAYWQTGTIDIARYETIVNKGSMTGKNILPYFIDSSMACDIDDMHSLGYAEDICRRIRVERFTK